MIKTETILKFLACQTKIKIICKLFSNPKGVSAGTLKEKSCLTSRSNYSKQINELRRIGLVVFVKEGRKRFYSINPNLPEIQVQMLKAIVNAFHAIDENEPNFCPKKN